MTTELAPPAPPAIDYIWISFAPLLIKGGCKVARNISREEMTNIGLFLCELAKARATIPDVE